MKPNLYFTLVFIALTGAALACNVGGSDQAATVTALSESLRVTDTPAAESTVALDASLQTAEAEATAVSVAATATEAVRAAADAEARAATAAILAPILAELPRYEIDPSEGQPGWVHPPVTLEIEGYQQYGYENKYPGTVAGDFVISGDITWNTWTGISGCGFVLRSDGNEEGYNQYLVIATRGATGHVIFGMMADGEVVHHEDIFAGGIDPAFEWQNDTTNRLTVVGRGNAFTIYTNGTRIGQVSAAEYDIGFTAMVALSESGRTVCRFTNTWLWLLN